MLKRAPFDHFQSAKALSDSPVIHWRDDAGEFCQSKPGPLLQTAGIERARRARGPASYHGKRNLEGNYYFAQVGEHVWFESAAEKHTLMALDFAVPIRAVAAQPFRIAFPDGTSHIPDYLAIRLDYHGMILDVHTQDRTTVRDRDHFERTADVAEQIGWSYHVVDDLPTVQRWNLEFLCMYRHPQWEPPAAYRHDLLEYLAIARTVGAVFTRFASVPGHQGGLFHLMWTREVAFDLTENLDSTTLVHRTTEPI